MHYVLPCCVLTMLFALLVAAVSPWQVQGKRWKVNLNSRQEASLLLSAVNLPGGVQVSQSCLWP